MKPAKCEATLAEKQAETIRREIINFLCRGRVVSDLGTLQFALSPQHNGILLTLSDDRHIECFAVTVGVLPL